MATIIQHTFTGANSTTSIPTADTGQTATVSSGTWGINANRTYVNGGTTGLIYWETGVADSNVSADLTWQSNAGLVTRLTDANNFLFIRINSSSLALFKNVAGTATSLGSYAMTPVAGTSYNVKITTNGTSVTVYLNGTSVISVTETFNQTATKAGLREGTTTASFYDNFLVESLGGTPSTQDGTASIIGTGTLSATATNIQNALASIVGTGTLTASPVLVKEGSAGLLSTGLLTANSLVLREGTAVLQGQGILIANADVIHTPTTVDGVFTSLGTGFLTVNGEIIPLEWREAPSVNGEIIQLEWREAPYLAVPMNEAVQATENNWKDPKITVILFN